jgi:hypothetical protein
MNDVFGRQKGNKDGYVRRELYRADRLHNRKCSREKEMLYHTHIIIIYDR